MRRRKADDATFLRLALLPHRTRVVEALKARAWAKSEHLELSLVGVPGVETAAVFCWPEPIGRPRRVLVDVVRLDRAVLDVPVQLAFELFPGERPKVADETPPVVVEAGDDLGDGARPETIIVNGPEGEVTWRLVGRAAYEKEVQRVDEGGLPVLGLVDTGSYCYRMTCPRCGRVRYAKPNSIHQIFWCRVCMRTIRLRRRALTQYKSRYGRPR